MIHIPRPTISLLLYCTAFKESDSSVIMQCFVTSLDKEILIAWWIANISAQSISMKGIGEENIHTKFPTWFRRMPPIADDDEWRFTEASTFHLRLFTSGGVHSQGDGIAIGKLDTEEKPRHIKHVGFLWMSIGEYGKSSDQPLIHHLILNSCRSSICFGEFEVCSNIRMLHSFQIDHAMTKKHACNTFSKKGIFFGDFHCSKVHLKLWGNTHLTSHRSIHQCHNCWEKSHWRMRWLHDSDA